MRRLSSLRGKGTAAFADVSVVLGVGRLLHMPGGLSICLFPAGLILKHVSPRGCERWPWASFHRPAFSKEGNAWALASLTDVLLLTAAGREFAPQIPGSVWRYFGFCCSLMGRWLLASGGWRPGRPLSTLQRTGRPSTENDPSPVRGGLGTIPVCRDRGP